MIVCKFGGTSVAKLEGAEKIKQIVKANSNRKIIVVSALGKFEKNSVKVTDLLFQLFMKIKNNEEYISSVNEIFNRYEQLSKQLQINIDWEKERNKLLQDIEQTEVSRDYIVSRGEFYSAKLYAKYLHLKFIDAKDCIVFYKNKKVNYLKTAKKLKKFYAQYGKFVIGGYYGADENGKIITFDRGGSDITGSIIAKLLNATMYENYTDVDGVFDKNPNIFEGAKQLPFLSFKTAIQMAENGNEIVHKSALMELKRTQTILIVKNTFNYNESGTIIADCNIFLNDVFVCVNSCYLLKFNALSKEVENTIKEKTQVQKVIKFNEGYYIIVKTIYDNDKMFEGLQNYCSKEKVYVVSVFSNLKLNNEITKKLSKTTKKIKENIIFSGFLSYLNNFIIILNENNFSNFVKNNVLNL